jgi:hypothetical protein
MAKKAQPTAKPSERAVEAPDQYEAPAPRRGAIKVEATQLGYYDDKRRRIGDVFTITSMKEFSDRWMRRVDSSTPERITTGAEELRRHHDEILKAKAAGGGIGPDNPEFGSDLLDE